MSLNHVSYWENGDWHHVTVKEASEKSHCHTIRANEKRLLCDLCNHFVTLSVGKVRDPYFKHSKGDIDKNCPERSKQALFTLPTHFAGLKIVIDKEQKFHLELVLPHAANPGLSKYKNLGIYHKHHKKIQKIAPVKIDPNNFSTKVNLGSTVANKYTLYNDLPDHSDKIADFETLQSKYLIFRSSDGMRVNLGGELNPNNEYIVLTTKNSFTYPGINEKLLVHSNGWNVFQISFDTHFGPNKLRPFLQINDLGNDAGIDYRITKNVADVDLIWPEHFKNEDGISYLGDTLYLYKHGQAWLDYAPRTNKRPNLDQDRLLQLFENPQLFTLKPNDNNGMVVAYGRNTNDIANYKQFIPTSQASEQSKNDLSLKPYTKEHHHYIKPLYNATLKQYMGKFEVSSQSLEANKPFCLPNLVAGSSLKVFYGADCVFSQTAKISKPQSKPSQSQPSTIDKSSANNDQSRLNDSELLNLLKRQIGEATTFTIVSNRLKRSLTDYPTTYQWVCSQARQQNITIKAKNILNKIVNGEYY